MSWEQDYSVPAVSDLLEQLTNKTGEQLLFDELERQGLKVVKTENILLDDGMYLPIHVVKVFLSDGRVFFPKLVRTETSNGNWGCDTYEYCLENETPTVERINHDDDHEYPLEADGELSNDNIGC